MYIKINNNHIELIKSANPYLIFATIFVFIIGLYYSLFQSPPDYIQGDSMRIMYIHVPSAWFALMTYSILAVSCVLWFITRNPLFNVVARSIAQVGMVFTLMSLITGSIWGKPTWGVWWVWDARLTSMLILFFLYIAYIFLWQAISNKELASKISAALAIIGFINIPIIKFSVDWWSTLHQPSSVRLLEKTTIHSSMLVPLTLMTAAFALFSLLIFLMKYNTELIKIKNKGLDRL